VHCHQHCPICYRLFNLFIQSGKVPTEWKQSLVVPVPKSYDLSSPNNYRPISLLSILSKLLEPHIYMHVLITTHLTENNIMSDAQWVFQQARAQSQLCLIQLITGLRSWKMERMSTLYFLTTVKCLTRFHTAPVSKLSHLGIDASIVVGWQTISLSDSRELLSMELLLIILQCSLECHRRRY